MKKVIPAFICLFLLTTCGYEIPESITIKGNPGLYIPLGSPFAGMKEEDKLESLISLAKIREMMNSGASGEGLEIYEVSKSMAENHGIDGEVLTYLVEYQLADMPLDLQKYMDQATEAVNSKEEINIPSITGTTGPFSQHYYIYGDGTDPSTDDKNIPFIKIPLNDMAKLVKEVRRGLSDKFGLEISVDPQLTSPANLEYLKEYLELKIPALGINNYTKGTLVDNKLQFVDTRGTAFKPRYQLEKIGNDYVLWIYARISGYCSGIIEPGVVFEWKEAVIDTSETDGSSFNQEYPIENMLGNFLGGTVSFKQVSGYVYMSGMNDAKMTGDITMTVDIDAVQQTRKLKDAKPSFTVTTNPDGTKIADGSLTTSSFKDDTSPLDLTPMFEGTDKKILKVNIAVPEVTITKSSVLDDSKIQSRLFAMIPLDLKVSDQFPDFSVTTDNGINIQNNYVPLDLGNPFNLGGGDLFGRKGDKDDIINEIDEVGISLRDIQVSVIDKNKLAVLIKSYTTYKLLEFSNSAPSLTFEKAFISYPFSPVITILLAKDNDTGGEKKDFGSFKILRTADPKFDFKLDVKAKAKFNYTIDLTKKE